MKTTERKIATVCKNCYCGAQTLLRFNEPGALMVDTPAHGSAASGSGDGVDTHQFYLTLTAGYYNENFHVDMPQTFHTSDRRLAMAAPALQAELDYTGLGKPLLQLSWSVR
jgi:hypothetical protein